MVAKLIPSTERRQPGECTKDLSSRRLVSPNARVNALPGRHMVGQAVYTMTTTKKKTHSKRFLKIKQSMAQPGPKFSSEAERFNTPQQGVQRAIKKFEELLSLRTRKSGSSTTEVLKEFRCLYPSLCVNNTYSMLGAFGHVPGVEVGDNFSWRAELCLVGLHRLTQAGIDWKDVTFTRGDGNTESLAISVVVSGGYEDDLDEGETLVYTGSGGREKGAKRQTRDQTLEGGNLALYNSQIRKHSIRVIRGQPDATRPSSTVYSYDGLYKIVNHVLEKGKSGYQVYKFKLVRQTDQAPLIWPPRRRFPLTGQISQRYAGIGRKHRKSGEGKGSSVISDEEDVLSDEEVFDEEDVDNLSDGDEGDGVAEGRECGDSESQSTNSSGRHDEKKKRIEGENSDDEVVKDGEYEVKCLLDKRTLSLRHRKRDQEYLVWWKGYPEEEATWEPITNLTHCADMLHEFAQRVSSR